MLQIAPRIVPRLRNLRIKVFVPVVLSKTARRRIALKALVYNGPKDVSVDKVPDAKIEKPTDVVVKITTTNICGSDLHMYEGRTSVKKGKVLGHENLGRVEETPSIP
jgi:hypothetical protein